MTFPSPIGNILIMNKPLHLMTLSEKSAAVDNTRFILDQDDNSIWYIKNRWRNRDVESTHTTNWEAALDYVIIHMNRLIASEVEKDS